MSKILAFSGSNSKESINQKLVQSVSNMAQLHEVEVISLRDYEAPLYGIDLENESGIPNSILMLNEKFNEASGFIVSTPEHNGSMPAVLKNTIDWLSRIKGNKVFKEMPTFFLSASPGPRGGVSALDHLVTIMPYRGAKVIGSSSFGNFHENFKDGEISNEKLGELKNLVQKLEEAVGKN